MSDELTAAKKAADDAYGEYLDANKAYESAVTKKLKAAKGDKTTATGSKLSTDAETEAARTGAKAHELKYKAIEAIENYETTLAALREAIKKGPSDPTPGGRRRKTRKTRKTRKNLRRS
jgi:hypothetical protein